MRKYNPISCTHSLVVRIVLIPPIQTVMLEDNQQQQQPTVAELQAITVNAMKSQFCSLTSFVGIPHDLTYKEDSEGLMMSVRKDILNAHLIVCETLQ